MSLNNETNSPESVAEKVEKARKMTGRIIAAVCSAAVLAVSLPLVSTYAGAADTTITASTTVQLNMRKGAGTSYAVVKVLDKNTSLTVIDKSNKDWIKVRLSDGSTGYCSAQYLDITTDAKTTAYLNMRSGAGTNYSVVKTIAPDTKLDILSFYGSSWAYVKLSDGSKGYVCTDYVSYLGTGTTVKTETGSTQTPQLTIAETTKRVALGSSFTVKVTTNSGGTIAWSSSNTKVITVNSSGTIKAVGVGAATVNAVDSVTKQKVVCTVTVLKTDVTAIKLSATTASVKIGGTLPLNPSITPSNGSVKYTTSDKSVATVSDKGVVTGVAAGTATIKVADSTGVVSASVKVTVQKPTTVTLTTTSATTISGSSVKLTAKTNDGSAVKWTSSDNSIAAVTDGVVSAFRSGTVTITASDSTGRSTAKCTVRVNPVSTSGMSMSRYSTTLTAGKSILIKGYSNYSASWASSDTSVAEVKNGIITTKKAGKVAITYTDIYGNREICVVTVNEAAPVRFTYSSPNSAVMNSTVKLVAITDKNRTNVRFKINNGGTYEYVTATEKTGNGNTYIWKASYKVTKAGTFSYEAQAYSSGSWKTCDDGKDSIYVSSKTNKKTTSLDKLRASDELIAFIGDKEGFVSTVYYDSIANYLPTLGHGIVIWEGDTFYNNLTKAEGYAMLVDSINSSSFTAKVNNMLVNNNVRFNQQQFDALVSFSYNLGPAWTTSSTSTLRSILLDSYGTVASGSTVTGTVVADGGLNLRSGSTTASSVVKVLRNGESVTLLSTEKYNSVWYKVKNSDGTTGYCSGTYLRLSTGSAVGRDLNYVNKNAFIKDMLSYHHSCGICYYGLLYRRADEVEMFLYGDYASDGRNNKYNLPDPYCISFP